MGYGINLSRLSIGLSSADPPQTRMVAGTFHTFHAFQQVQPRARACARECMRKSSSASTKHKSVYSHTFSRGKYGKYGRNRMVERQTGFPCAGKIGVCAGKVAK